MDGFAFRQQQLADPHLTAVPIVCLTGHYEPEQVSMQLGVACLSKPPHFPTILKPDVVQGGRRPSERRFANRREATDRLTTAGAPWPPLARRSLPCRSAASW